SDVCSSDLVKAARSSGKQKPVIFMGDRDDHYTTQAGDGYAAFIGGSTAQATHAMNEWWGKEGMGTMPHAMIQMFKGDVVAATKAYHEVFPDDDLVALVDYNNDVITDSLKVARAFGEKLKGRSEEHTSELQSRENLVCRLLLEKKN